MKAFVTSIIVLIIFTTLVITNSIYTAHLCGEYYDKTKKAVSAENTETPPSDLSKELEYFKEIKENWDKEKNMVNLSISHDHINEVDQNIVSVIGACETNNYTIYNLYLQRTLNSFETLENLSKLKLDNII